MRTTLILTMTGAKRQYRNLGEMMRSFGCPQRDIQLVKSTRTSYFVYIQGGLVGEATQVRQ